MDNTNLIEEMRKMLRQELGNFRNQLNQQKPIQQHNKSSPNNQKPNLAGAVSIRDEIRRIVREELQAMKNHEQRKTQIVQQQKSTQKPQNNQPQKQQTQNKPQANVVRITSVEQLASHLQNAINQQLQKKQQINKPVSQVKVTSNAIRPQQNNQSKNFAQKNVVSQKQAGDLLSNIARKVPKPQNSQQKK